MTSVSTAAEATFQRFSSKVSVGWRAACEAQQVVSALEEKNMKKLPRLKSGSKRHSANAKSFMLTPALSSLFFFCLFFSSVASVQQQQPRHVFFKAAKTQAGEASRRYAFFLCPPSPKPRTVWLCNFNGQEEKEGAKPVVFFWIQQTMNTESNFEFHVVSPPAKYFREENKKYTSQTVFLCCLRTVRMLMLTTGS